MLEKRDKQLAEDHEACGAATPTKVIYSIHASMDVCVAGYAGHRLVYSGLILHKNR